MGKIISISNQKGGVGKTTTVINFGACLAAGNEEGRGGLAGWKPLKILIIDADPQANTTSGLGFDKSNLTETIYEVLINDAPAESAVLKYEAIPGLDILPSGIQLAGAPVEIVSFDRREWRFKDCIEPLRDKYDFILIDCPPSLGLLTLNAMTAADSILIPVQCEYYALEGISQLLQTVNLVRGSFNPDLDIEGFLLTMHNSTTNLSSEVIEEVKGYFKEKVFNAIIPRNVRLSEAPSYGKPIILYDRSSSGAQMYMKFTQEFIERNNKPAAE